MELTEKMEEFFILESIQPGKGALSEQLTTEHIVNAKENLPAQTNEQSQ